MRIVSMLTWSEGVQSSMASAVPGAAAANAVGEGVPLLSYVTGGGVIGFIIIDIGLSIASAAAFPPSVFASAPLWLCA